MNLLRPLNAYLLPAVIFVNSIQSGHCQEKLSQHRLRLTPEMISTEFGNGAAIADEQEEIVGTPIGDPDSTWKFPKGQKVVYPHSVQLDLGAEQPIAALWIYDTNGKGDLQIDLGSPGKWKKLTTYGCGKYKRWVKIPVDAMTRHLRLTRMDGGANFSEIAVYRYTPEAYEAVLAKKAEEARRAAERAAALKRAHEEMLKRPLVDAGPVFGKLRLIEEIETAKTEPTHQSPANVSTTQTILGKRCRVIPKTKNRAAFFSYRIGKMKLLQPGEAYVLEVEYPEDAPRSVIVMNGANESSAGFHTGTTFGDALHVKYVNGLNESLDLPLSGDYQHWRTLFRLHDRTPDIQFIRGDAKPRTLTPEDGFTVTIAQFSAKNIPFSQGAAVSHIRLYAVEDPSLFDAPVRLPEGLPQRRLFWREEMSDGVVSSDEAKRGVTNPLDWWRFKRDRMRFLGFNTFTKDLLEFGAVQHWDTTLGGGNEWAYFNSGNKDWWPQIVEMMGDAGFDVLPYYEYSGSKGAKGLGNQRRAKPLKRDDAYSHISWVESSNADITDPDTYADFQKMLDLTIVSLKDKAKFAGAWIRTRGQIPMSFAAATLKRFADETSRNQPTRQKLIDDQLLLAEYKQWWFGKRRQFFLAMRDHLRSAGVEDAQLLYTACAAEPGVGFPTWDSIVVADEPERLSTIETAGKDKPIVPLSVAKVKADHRYLQALTAERLNWGNWELDHQTPPSDPATYAHDDGVMLSHAFNRLYTVTDPQTFETFRNPTGLTLVRHFSLNENMLFDENDKEIAGYFIADFERAGPFCMMAEAHAIANGDPTQIGYLSGGNFNRGFPEYVRSFNAAFLALPALPSRIVPGASSHKDIVVRQISTPKHGTYFAVVSLSRTQIDDVSVRLPVAGEVIDAVTGQTLANSNAETIRVSMHPCQLRTLHVAPQPK